MEKLSKYTVINEFVNPIIALIEVNKLPLSTKAIKAFKSRKLLLIADDNLKHSNIRYEVDKGACYINVSDYAKEVNSLEGIEYKMQANELYAFLIGGYTYLNFKILNNNRDVQINLVKVWLELIKKPILKNAHISSQSFRNKLDYILLQFILRSNEKINGKGAITNIAGFSKKQSDISDEEEKLMHIKYKDELSEKGDYFTSDRLWEILQNEFLALKDIKFDSFLYQIIYCFGAVNDDILVDLKITATIIVDYIYHNKATLNILKNNFIKDAIKPVYYNDIVNLFNEKG